MAWGRFGRRPWAFAGRQEKGLNLAPFRIGILVALLFDVLVEPPKSSEGVFFFFLPEARLGCGLGSLRGGRSWALGEDKEGLQLGPLGKPDFRTLLFDVLIGNPKSSEGVCFFFLPEARLGCGLVSLRGGGHGP